MFCQLHLKRQFTIRFLRRSQTRGKPITKSRVRRTVNRHTSSIKPDDDDLRLVAICGNNSVVSFNKIYNVPTVKLKFTWRATCSPHMFNHSIMLRFVYTMQKQTKPSLSLSLSLHLMLPSTHPHEISFQIGYMYSVTVQSSPSHMQNLK